MLVPQLCPYTTFLPSPQGCSPRPGMGPFLPPWKTPSKQTLEEPTASQLRVWEELESHCHRHPHTEGSYSCLSVVTSSAGVTLKKRSTRCGPVPERCCHSTNQRCQPVSAG
ncbi:hypothetical protein I79_020839 [Cricetulus griseus]|uniref:Uncharacterized protein n=1 Tax=Cricetulus griseus TaxID=10029 RepID=G3IB50_CRIGR|nr:hypothetical protein I79_020839 [Cricetulus griseus]